MKTRSSYRHLLPYLRLQWPLFARGIAFILGYVSVTLFLPHLAGQVAFFVGQGKVQEAAYWLAVATGVFLLRSFFQYGQGLFMMQASLFVVFSLRKRVYTHLHQLGLDYFEKAQTGDLTYRLTEDMERIGEIVNKLSLQLISCGLQLIFLPIYMIYLNWPLTLAGLIIAPLMAVLIGQFGERLLALSRRNQTQVSNISALLTEVFSNIRIVKAFAAWDYEIDRFTQEAEHNRQIKYQAEKLKYLQYPIVGFLEALSIMLLFFIGGWQISKGDLTSSGLVSYLAAVALLLHPIELVTTIFNEFKQAEASVERVFDLLKVPPAFSEPPDAITLDSITGKVEYSHVSFAYQPDQPVLIDLSLKIYPGEIVALVGSSGAGKTTLVNLLLGFYTPQAGQILIDGIDIRDVSVKSLHTQISIVPQDTMLFSGNIAQNIAYGQSELDFKSIEEAAKIANAHSFITQLPQGYHTWLGERGVNLSGGQRQRLAIARAILLNPRILILDEATSALDSESEALVQEALERAMKNRTVFIIAHRFSTIRQADCILFLEKGKVIESGTHAELLVKNGRYAQFYAQQFNS